MIRRHGNVPDWYTVALSLGYKGWLPTSYLHSTFVTKK